MFKLMEEVQIEYEAEICKYIIYAARGGHCRIRSKDGNRNVAGLSTDYKEADTKTAYLAKHAEDEDGGKLCAL